MDTPVELVSNEQLLGINISTDIYDRHYLIQFAYIIYVEQMRCYFNSTLFLVILNPDLCQHFV